MVSAMLHYVSLLAKFEPNAKIGQIRRFKTGSNVIVFCKAVKRYSTKTMKIKNKTTTRQTIDTLQIKQWSIESIFLC